jgi:pimeloyl-ACP methyl ester carboxylesterase
MALRPNVLFLPGLLCDAALWASQIEGLRDIADVSVADLTLDDSITGMARRVVAAAREGRFVAVALSMGGYVAFELARRVPERIAGLALLDTTAAPDTPERATERREGIANLAAGRFAGVTSRLLPKLVHRDKANGPVGAAVQAMVQRVGGEAYVRQQQAILGRPDSRPVLSEVRAPTLVAVGAQDILTPPPEARVIRDGIAASRYHVFSGCGHLPPLELPGETTAVLRNWLIGSGLSR